MRLLRIVDGVFVIADQDAARAWCVIAPHALNQGTFTRTIFTQQSVEATRAHLHRHIIQRDEIAKAFGQANDFHAYGMVGLV